jgi:hypothetical protein
MNFLQGEMANKRKDGSEERLIFSANAQAASNDTSLDENGQESAISVVSKIRSSMHPCVWNLRGSMENCSAIILQEQEVSLS